MNKFTATYSPDDNKLRLYASARLDAELYARVRAAGFTWAPRQELFVAGRWTPDREDLLLELAGEIDDEDKSLVDRAEDRAERFEDYREKRTDDALRAKAAVDRIAEGIPLGQPILVGHHSEKHARRDAERIRSGMANAVRLWDTAQYWKSRAAGALRHAKYKESPSVRHRRIKTLGAEKRKEERHRVELERWAAFWAKTDLTLEQVLPVLRSTYEMHGGEPVEKALESGTLSLEVVVENKNLAYRRSLARSDRWLEHYENRIAYETAMLDEQIGTGELGYGMAGRFDLQVGGQIFDGREWLVILKVNKVAGADVVNSVSTVAPKHVTWAKTWNYPVERIMDYQAPTAEEVERVKKATKLPPLCNYPGEGFKEMTEAEWKRASRASDMSHIRPIDATTTAGRHRARFTMLPGWKRAQVFVTDIKRNDPPAPLEEPSVELSGPVRPAGTNLSPEVVGIIASAPLMKLDPVAAGVRRGLPHFFLDEAAQMTPQHLAYGAECDTAFDAAFEQLRKAAKTGVEVVTVPNLFPTPADVADKVVSLLGIEPGDRVLEPSAGTGSLIEAIVRAGAEPVTVDAVEVNRELAQRLINRPPYPHMFVRCGDFLEMNVGHLGDLGRFDKILMNPPFQNGADILHVARALQMLKRGGRLVAIMAAGPRQKKWAEEMAPTHIESLPPGTFAGTDVSAMIVVIEGGEGGAP